MLSATTMQASLPDWMMMPRIRSSTAMRVPSSTNIFEPWVRQARSDTGSVSVSFMRPSFRRWNSSSRVISLDMEAGGIGVRPSFCHSTWPVSASISRRMFGAGVHGGQRRRAPARQGQKREGRKMRRMTTP